MPSILCYLVYTIIMKTYLIRQKITPLANQYNIYESADGSNPGTLVGFAHQKRLALKEKITVYTDANKQTTAFDVQARQIVDLGARYDVRDASGSLLGTIGKDFKSSLTRSTWKVFLPGQEQSPALTVFERNQTVAIFRRIWDLLPIIGDFPFFLAYHFDFADTANTVIASYSKTKIFRDHYRLDIQENAGQVDPRVLIALGVMLDALQGR